jgi:hypothetical protein
MAPGSSGGGSWGGGGGSVGGGRSGRVGAGSGGDGSWGGGGGSVVVVVVSSGGGSSTAETGTRSAETDRTTRASPMVAARRRVEVIEGANVVVVWGVAVARLSRPPRQCAS